MYKNILWDFDGTLFDTYPVMGRVFQEELAASGIDEPLDIIIQKMRISMFDVIEYYEQKYGIDDEFLMAYQKRRYIKEASNCKPFEGVGVLCKKIAVEGKQNFLYTHRGVSSIEFLKKFDMYTSFTDFITHESGFDRKPSPDGVNYLIEKFGLNRAETIMIGDRELDVLAGKNAGIDACLIVEDELKDEVDSVADHVVHSVKELYSILF